METKIEKHILKNHSQKMKNTAWILGGILLLAFLLRVCPLKDLNHSGLSFGEVQMMRHAALPLSEIVSFGIKDQGPLKFHLLHAVLYLGRDEFLLRLPALFFDLAAILLVFYLGGMLFDRKTGLLACFFMAVSPWHIHYATLAKSYPLYIFLMLASSFFLYRAIKTSNIRDWVFFTMASLFAFYSFYPSIIVLAAQVCWFFLCYGRRSDLIKRLGISLGLFIAMIAPWWHRLMVAFESKRYWGNNRWGMQGGEIWEALRDHLGGIAGPLPWGIFIFVLSFVWIFYFQKKKSQAIFLLALVVIPISFYIFCYYVLHLSIAPRYFLLSYPFFLLMAASGIASWPHWAGRLTGIVIFLMPLCLYGFYQAGVIKGNYIPSNYLRRTEDFSGITSLIKRNYTALDFVVVERAPSIFGIQYYLDKTNKSPVTTLRKNSGPKYFMYTDSQITLYGVDGELPLLKSLAADGRLLVVDIDGHIGGWEGGDAIISWLKSNAYRIEHDYGANFYFISPPSDISKTYKDSSAIARQKLFSESRVLGHLIYPFNKEWSLHEK